MTKAQFDLVSDIINNKNPVLKNYHIVSKPDFLEKKVILYSQIQINAVNKIKKQWLKCRYDPKYLLFEA